MKLVDKLRAALEFDDDSEIRLSRCDSYRGAEQENNRLSPYHEALLECVEAIEKFENYERVDFSAVLTKLEALLSKGEM